MSCLVLKLLLILIVAGWVSLWVLKPTEFWTRKWKEAEEKAMASVFGYNGLDFVVYTFPVIAMAIIGFIYLELKQKEPRNRQRRSAFTSFSSPLFVNQYIGILSGAQILASSLFIIFLVWTFYARVSNDFKKMTPVKSFKLSLWQYKLFRMATRCGLLAEACLALLLLPVLRGMSVFRLLGIQFEASVRYHIWLGTAMVFFATLHSAGTFFIWGMKHRIQDEMWKWQKKGRIYLAGEMALITALVIWITSLPQIRRSRFHLFYYTHHLYIVFLVLFLFHGGDRHFYMVFPGVFLFALDKLLRIIQSRPETCVLSARVFPCKAIELTLPKDPRLKYTPASVIFLKIPSISKIQWHPFSVTSTCRINEHTVSVIVKCEGEWTSSLYDIIHDEADSEADRRQCIPVAVEGPYGPASLDFVRYNNLLLVAGGIGITPFVSIVREISSNYSRSGYPDRIQLIYTVRKSQDVCLLDPILPQLLNVEQFHIKLKVFVTRENQTGTTLREALNEIPETRTTYFSTTCTSYATYGPERLLWMAAIATGSSIIFLLLLVCFNHFVNPPAKKRSEQKNSSSQVDLLLLCSFAIAITCGTLIAITIRWKRVKKELQLFTNKQSKTTKQSSVQASRDLHEHEIHFGGRPNFRDIFSDFTSETRGSDIGVLVCGPESLKESVASACRLALVSQKNAKEKRSNFSFHSLNFTL
ncbi:Ferric reduction oxidase 8, mitochondrial [Sesamum alatum]|uniref:Ferric reduction oxidase 8, mitochondrial n=1 Tax=Sesamum alatum TaxID=300844 RepID=A0AAE1YYQ9_9LAMI|nr:Ferric reduction oxidase 8, mitochondrial [Sesamum alatum]